MFPIVPRRLSAIALLLTFLPASAAFAQKKTPTQTQTQTQTQTPKKTQRLPKFRRIEQAVDKQLHKRFGYRRGDVISRGDVQPIFKLLKKMNWDVAEQKEISKRVLPDRDFLIRQLRTRKGVNFMRHLSARKHDYDRLDRLRRMPYGARRIRELIHSPGGYTLIQYMTGTRGGRNLGIQLSRVRSGRHFNAPVGRIYCERDLLKHLQVSYEAEIKRRKRKKPPAVKQKRLKRP